MRSLVHKAYGQVVESGVINLFASDRPDYEDGEQKRDFLYVKDAVEMTIHLAEDARRQRALQSSAAVRRTHGTRWPVPSSPALRREPRIEYIPMPEVLRSKYQYFTQANIARLRETGFSTIDHVTGRVGRRLRSELSDARRHLGDRTKNRRRLQRAATPEYQFPFS
jgi:ADP-L-glycero-D-manno-heptose 6-epimerase